MQQMYSHLLQSDFPRIAVAWPAVHVVPCRAVDVGWRGLAVLCSDLPCCGVTRHSLPWQVLAWYGVACHIVQWYGCAIA